MSTPLTRAVATVAGIGRLRPAPGTWGSAVGLAAGLAIDLAGGFLLLFAATAAVTLVGLWAVQAELQDRRGEDPPEIVIDEVAGQWMALCFPAYAFWSLGWQGLMPWPAWVGAFALFRLFDIWKPWLVGRADRQGDAAGVMLDDLWAGVFAGVVLVLLAGVWHGVMG